MRGNCFDDTTFSRWSDTVRFTLANTEGICHPASHQLATLSPNPAHSRVGIRSSAELRRITLYGLQRRPVLETPAHGQEATIDISTLAKGTYLVGILTILGHSTHRLVVE